MNAPTPARSLMERAAEVYGYADWWQAPPAGEDPAPAAAGPQPAPPSRAPEAVPIDLARLSEAGFVRPGAPPSLLSEEVRLAKRPLLAAALGEDAGPRARLMLVCSANSGDGKTFCAANLALSLAAERDTEVLLVDGDVAKPSVAEVLGIPAGAGLMDAVAAEATDPEQLVLATDLPTLKVLRAGSALADATELLASRRCRAVLDALAAADPRRLLVIDSPPLLAASPATSLALHAGQAVLVVRADRTTEADLRDAYSLLAGVPAVHLLLNGVTAPSARARYGSYYGPGR